METRPLASLRVLFVSVITFRYYFCFIVFLESYIFDCHSSEVLSHLSENINTAGSPLTLHIILYINLISYYI